MSTPNDNTAAEVAAEVERQMYARLWNAVASELDSFCTRRGHARPYFSERNRVAAAVWHRLHPESALGRPENNGGSDA